MTNSSGKWAALITSYLLFFSSAVIFFEVPPLIEYIRADMPLDDIAFGWIQGMYALPAVLFAIVGGSIIDRFDSRVTGILSGILLLAGNLLFNAADNLALMLIGRFLVGVGTIIINLVSARMLTLWFPVTKRGFAMSILHTAWPITVAFLYSTFVASGKFYGWNNVIHGVNIFTVFALVIFILFAPKDNVATKISIARNPFSAIKKIPFSLLLTAIAWFCFASSMMSIFTFGATYFADHGKTYEEGSMIVGLLMTMAIPGSIIAGQLIDRIGNLKKFIIIPGMLASIVFLLFLFGVNPIILMILAGLLAAIIPTAVYAYPGSLVNPSSIGLAFGIILTFSNLGNTISPIFVGWLISVTHFSASSIIVSSSLILCVALIGLMLPKTTRVTDEKSNLQGALE